MTKIIKGSCLCGEVEYSIVDSLKYAGYCHCSQCRKLTGSPFSASGGVANSDFTILKGEDRFTCFEKVEGSPTYFCNNCSAFIYGEVSAHKMTYVLLGTLSESPSLKPQWHVYTNYKVDWYEISDGLPQYGEKIPR
jgi:hypothetical protein